MQIKQMKLDAITSDPNNARLHDETNLAAIQKSLKSFGQQKPIVIDQEGVILAGNGTYAAARALGWEHIACVESSLEGQEASAYAIADNRSAELAVWNEEQLSETLQMLEAQSAQLLESTGFEGTALNKAMTLSFQPDELSEQPAALPALYQVIVVCDDEATQRGAHDYLLEGGYTCRLLTL